VDISADNAMWASGSLDETARIWNLDTGKLVAGPLTREKIRWAQFDSPQIRKSLQSGRCGARAWNSKSG
ncbi:hypothetical protein CY34DRAFT_56366, partial [Suillus luteus UH-Slu-Lm8-n1]